MSIDEEDEALHDARVKSCFADSGKKLGFAGTVVKSTVLKAVESIRFIKRCTLKAYQTAISDYWCLRTLKIGETIIIKFYFSYLFQEHSRILQKNIFMCLSINTCIEF